MYCGEADAMDSVQVSGGLSAIARRSGKRPAALRGSAAVASRWRMNSAAMA